MKRFQKSLMAAVIALAIFGFVNPASSHQTNYTSVGGNVFPDKWANPPVWNLNPARNANILPGRTLAEVMQASFATWANAPGSAATAVRGADSSSTASGLNSENLVCFVCQGDFSQEAETLAVTITTTTTQVGVSDGRGGITRFIGQILDSDILFNPSRTFSPDASGGEDIQTVATHEIGHFYGLNHSAVVRSMMFPYSPDNQRLLSYDDVAAISTKYPNGSQATGVLAGTVRLGGTGVFGAHVFAESQTVAEIWPGVRKSPISTLSLPDGSYRIEGLPADVYSVTAEPLDLPVVGKDVQDFGNAYSRTVRTNFTTRWH